MGKRKQEDQDARKRLFDRLFMRDREFIGGTWRVRCKYCGRFVSSNPKSIHTVIDHKDNNPANDALVNRQLIHRRCNYLKDPRGSKPVEKGQQAGDDDVISGEMRKNRIAEPVFVKWLLGYIEDNGPSIKEIVVNAGAWKAKVSPITTARWLKKVCSVEAPLMVTWDEDIDQDVVRFRHGRHANDEIQI